MTIDDLWSIENIRNRIEQNLKVDPHEEYGEQEYLLRHPNGRQFLIRCGGDNEFFLSECKPIGRIVRSVNGTDIYEDEPRILHLLDDPNNFMSKASEIGISPDSIISSFGGFSLGSIYIADLSAVAQAIHDSIQNNDWYQSISPELAASRMANIDHKGQSEAYQKDLSNMQKAADQEHGLFRGLHNMSGALHQDSKERLLAYMNAQTLENWSKISGLMIKNHKTVWSIWCQVDATAPRSLSDDGAWPKFPDRDMFFTILNAARPPHEHGYNPEQQVDQDLGPTF